MSEEPNLRKLVAQLAVQCLAAPTIEAMAKRPERGAAYYDAFLLACRHLVETSPEIMATFDADRVAREMLGQRPGGEKG